MLERKSALQAMLLTIALPMAALDEKSVNGYVYSCLQSH